MNHNRRKPLDLEGPEAAEILECVYTTLLTTEIDPDKTDRTRDRLQKVIYWLRRAHEVLHGPGSADEHTPEIDPGCPIHGDGHQGGPPTHT